MRTCGSSWTSSVAQRAGAPLLAGDLCLCRSSSTLSSAETCQQQDCTVAYAPHPAARCQRSPFFWFALTLQELGFPSSAVRGGDGLVPVRQNC